VTNSPFAPILPDGPDLALPPPYQLSVPSRAALTLTSLQLKNTLWPTIFAPRRKYEPEEWSRAKVRWAYQAIITVAEEARRGQQTGEVGPCRDISCRVTIEFTFYLSFRLLLIFHLPSRMQKKTRSTPLLLHTTLAFPRHIYSDMLCSVSFAKSLITAPARGRIPPFPYQGAPRPQCPMIWSEMVGNTS